MRTTPSSFEAAQAQREEMRALLTPEAFERLEAAEREAERRFLFGA
jgi:predicted lipid-binding transport protein (Tim44 family)